MQINVNNQFGVKIGNKIPATLHLLLEVFDFRVASLLYLWVQLLCSHSVLSVLLYHQRTLAQLNKTSFQRKVEIETIKSKDLFPTAGDTFVSN